MPNNFNINQEVSSHLTFALILILSFLVAWYSLNTSQKVVDNAKVSETFNVNERLKAETDISRFKVEP